LRKASCGCQIPRLLDMVVPGFDRFLHQSIPDIGLPGTLLLPICVRIPVLAGMAQVISRPDRWAEALLGPIAESARPGLAECLRRLTDA
jgi:hypothetical protein